MDFLVDFLKALFIERDKEKVKNSILVIAITIVAGFLFNFFMDMKNSIENMTNYKIVVVHISDSIFTIKSNQIILEINEELGEIVELVHDLDDKRGREINYLAKYKDKDYQEIMDILSISNSRWESEVSRREVESEELVAYESVAYEPTTLVARKPATIEIEKPHTRTIRIEPKIDTTYKIMTIPSYQKKKKDNIFKRIFGRD